MNGSFWDQVSHGHLLVRLFIDLLSLVTLAVLLYFKRYRRRDVVVTLVTFNVGLFAVLTVITAEKVTAGVGFGLFAVLSIIRLRSEAVSNVELGYFFLALAVGLVNGFGRDVNAVLIGLNVIIAFTLFIVDHPSLHTTVRRRVVVLDSVYTDVDTVADRLVRDFRVELVGLAITEVDYVRETTRVVMRYVANPLKEFHTEVAVTGASDAT